MSRSIQEIFDEIIVEKETFSSLDDLVPNPDSSQTFLDDLTSSSKVAIWRLMFWVMAVAIFIHESLFDVFKADVEKRALEIVPAVTQFYVIEALKFQLGDELVFTDSTFKFADSTSAAALAKQIIKQASARDINEVVTLKIAGDDGSGGLAPIPVPDAVAFSAYVNKFKIAGTKTIIINEVADLLKIAYTIQFDPLVMKADGTLIADGTSPVQEAIDAYIKGLPFDSTFRVQDLTDAIQLARGVINAVADVVEAKFALLDFTNILEVNTETYLPNAGYLVTIDETGSPGSINVLAITENIVNYDSSLIYGIGDFRLFEGIAFKANVNIPVPEPFDPTKWDSVSNLTFIST